MAIIIKELIIKGKVVRDIKGVEMSERILEDYIKKIKKEIIESCKEQIKEELERERMQ